MTPSFAALQAKMHDERVYDSNPVVSTSSKKDDYFFFDLLPSSARLRDMSCMQQTHQSEGILRILSLLSLWG